ncbi:hypothetical protein K466DRAFT_607926 [Polyporus arcularius HHB13444]|uniref:Uncharacterized protein n=1 Tax=Polyporus arcularius HHB13444 TaxID=1314778 RepID=A0A5C3NNT6_9APHY|nr:hypothetical protein K466DRAFT_607926 [Polyporus arcularius HHB13444]
MDLDAATEENHAEDYSMEPSNGIVWGPGVDLFDESATDLLLRETYNDLPLLKTHVPNYGSYPIQTMLLGEGIVDQPHYKVHRRKLLDLILYAHNPQKDSPIVVNPARVSPNLLVPGAFHGSTAKVAAFKTPSGPQQAICYSVGVIFAIHANETTSFAKGNQQVKQILLGPLRGENERALGLLGNVFECDCLGINTFGVTASNGNKIQGLSIRTYPSPSASSGNVTARVLPGMGFTPSKGARTGAASSSDGRPSQSLLDMRDKTAWGSNNDSEPISIQ